MRFVPTEEERAQAKKRAKEINGAPLILWVLSGSSVHKVWPHMDPVMRSILNTFPNAQVVTAGDERCKLLEGVWEKDERVIKTSGKWSIRETLTFAQECNLVIGPETGVMSSVAMLPMPKIVLLSHSSVENLTRDWVNTISLSSKETPCSPCHRMVYDWSQCNKHEPTGAAHCMAHIQPQEMWASILEALEVKLEQGAAHA
jgi:ADP-heptose:LPS heptosyltransferase